MARNYTVSTHIKRPTADVYDAIVKSDRITRYFTNGSSGDLVEGARVVWRWDEYGEAPVTVTALEPNRRIELSIDSMEWQKTTTEAYPVRVIFEFEATDDGGTKLSISEDGWKTDTEGLKGSHDNCGGWAQVLLYLKAHLEYGIDLR